ncbi:DUF6891 domain-containing protein [Zobellia laminariae]|uniref:DUF6891 domain-containing protein n=1 Tax=Zobellia laminariae TaxID=248906 RepID=UPI0026F42866|nr:hypothetical protein [Zobellia laminariae]WKX74756.1 hypothetical protein Q5W13_13180 [Zobellia laminariae]
MGFLSISDIKENIIEEIEDNGFDEEMSEEWAFEIIGKEHQKLVSESENWETPTDTEKLIEAFDELCENNIIALHNAGYTTSDGEYEVVEIERNLRKNQVTSDGYCFYHEQDLSSAISLEDPCLYIAFQKVDNSDNNVTLNVGRNVVKVLTKKGLEVKWNEDVNTKILIPNFKWQYIYDERKRDLQDYGQIIEIMSKKKRPRTTPKNNDGNTAKTEDNGNNNIWSKLKRLWS